MVCDSDVPVEVTVRNGLIVVEEASGRSFTITAEAAHESAGRIEAAIVIALAQRTFDTPREP